MRAVRTILLLSLGACGREPSTAPRPACTKATAVRIDTVYSPNGLWAEILTCR